MNFLYNNTNSKFSNPYLRAPITVKNPLVVHLGSGDYIDDPLKGVPFDYMRVKQTFNTKLGWDLVYMTNQNQIRHVQTPEIGTDDIVNKGKLRWMTDDVFKFNTSILQILQTHTPKYDAILYFISSHGHKEDIIELYDAYYPLIGIVDRFDNKNCLDLRNKPKLYFIEACRGDQKTKWIRNDDFKPGTKDEAGPKNDHANGNSNGDSKSNKKQSENNKAQQTGNKQLQSNLIGYSKDIYSRKLYGNLEEYTVIDNKDFASNMIRGFATVMEREKFRECDLDQILIQTRQIMNALTNRGDATLSGTQVMDDHDNMPCKVFFKSKK